MRVVAVVRVMAVVRGMAVGRRVKAEQYNIGTQKSPTTVFRARGSPSNFMVVTYERLLVPV